MLELYHNTMSTCSQKVRLALAEKDLEYTSHYIDLGAFENLKPEYLAINPHGVVPTLVHDGYLVLESSVMCEYIDEVWPEPALSPGTALGRADMRAWMRYIEEVPTAAIRVPSFYKLWRQEVKDIPQKEFEQLSEAMSVRLDLFRQVRRSSSPNDDTYREAVENLGRVLDRVESALENGPWLIGEQFTIADIVLVPVIVRMEDLGMSDMWAHKPTVARWYQNVQSRPSFGIAYCDGSRIEME